MGMESDADSEVWMRERTRDCRRGRCLESACYIQRCGDSVETVAVCQQPGQLGLTVISGWWVRVRQRCIEWMLIGVKARSWAKHACPTAAPNVPHL